MPERSVVVVAPHPDDETIGCGGTLLKHRSQGDRLHWIILTAMDDRYPDQRRQAREEEIERVSAAYAFEHVERLGYATARLDEVPMSDLISRLSDAVRAMAAEILYVPFPGDVHSDHRIAFQAAIACSKAFRHASVKEVAAYEALSETEFGLDPALGFRPNLFVDIARHLEAKLAIMREFAGEVGEFPFPRSETAVRALAAYRGATAGCEAAEAFMLLKAVR